MRCLPPRRLDTGTTNNEQMLQQALGGAPNCKRTLLVTASLDPEQILETMSSLRFANRARSIQKIQKKKKSSSANGGGNAAELLE